MTEIVLKACAFRPSDRYSTPTELREALESILYLRENPTPHAAAAAESTARGFASPGEFQSGREETMGIWSGAPSWGTGEQTQSVFAVKTEAQAAEEHPSEGIKVSPPNIGQAMPPEQKSSGLKTLLIVILALSGVCFFLLLLAVFAFVFAGSSAY